MRKLTLLTIVFISLLAACKKDKPNEVPQQEEKAYSWWVVDGDSFRTNQVKVYTGHVSAIEGFCKYGTHCHNYFQITFHYGGEPMVRRYRISLGHEHEWGYVFIFFKYKNNGYSISPHETSYLYGSSENEKTAFTMEPTWFINSNDSQDSVLIEGVFREP